MSVCWDMAFGWSYLIWCSKWKFDVEGIEIWKLDSLQGFKSQNGKYRICSVLKKTVNPLYASHEDTGFNQEHIFLWCKIDLLLSNLHHIVFVGCNYLSVELPLNLRHPWEIKSHRKLCAATIYTPVSHMNDVGKRGHWWCGPWCHQDIHRYLIPKHTHASHLDLYIQSPVNDVGSYHSRDYRLI